MYEFLNLKILGPLDEDYIGKMTAQQTPGQKIIAEMEKLDVDDDPNTPFCNYWKDPDQIGFNRNLKAKEIHECFKDMDGQGISYTGGVCPAKNGTFSKQF